MMVQDNLIKLVDVTIGYPGQPLIPAITMSIASGERLAVVGPNGAGKSTLLFTILGLLKPLKGAVLRRPHLPVGYVPQRGRCDPLFSLRACDVVAMGGMGSSEKNFWSRLALSQRKQCQLALEQLGVGQLADQLFRDLSGGQQQRVLIARALVRRPELLVLDEPTAGMDIPSERDLLDLVSQLAQTQQMSVIFVMHQLALASLYAERLALISKDQQLFALDQTPALLTSTRLSQLYQRDMEVIEANGVKVIRPTRAQERQP